MLHIKNWDTFQSLLNCKCYLCLQRLPHDITSFTWWGGWSHGVPFRWWSLKVVCWVVYKWIQSIWVLCFILFLLADHINNLQLASGMCIRLEFMFLSTIIPYCYSLGRDMNVYLQPLINELSQLWSFRALTYDVGRKYIFLNENNFNVDYKWKISLSILYKK